ncbi:MAG TPA: NAD(P)H-dependent oxidoreductase [Phnomibacter sp.]|nr:NAD(P)H-dependent oxidoreductase [Phnomibacter sp.]
MPKILLQFAHPLLEKSRVQREMIRQAQLAKGVTINDLYEWYPDFDIDIGREQSLLLAHDIIIFQHPLYWYSSPAIVKQWFDLVLEHGWAYGSRGDRLKGKWMMNALSCGGSEQAYQPEGRNRYTIAQMLAPIEQTARLCHMEYLPPFVVYGTHRLTDTDIEMHCLQYGQVLNALQGGRIQPHEWQGLANINSLCPVPEPFQS